MREWACSLAHRRKAIHTEAVDAIASRLAFSWMTVIAGLRPTHVVSHQRMTFGAEPAGLASVLSSLGWQPPRVINIRTKKRLSIFILSLQSDGAVR